MLCGFLRTNKDVPKTRKKIMGPATSLSSMMSWFILPKGFRTAKVYDHISMNSQKSVS
jgi:hypothetical protein